MKREELLREAEYRALIARICRPLQSAGDITTRSKAQNIASASSPKKVAPIQQISASSRSQQHQGQTKDCGDIDSTTKVDGPPALSSSAHHAAELQDRAVQVDLGAALQEAAREERPTKAAGQPMTQPQELLLSTVVSEPDPPTSPGSIAEAAIVTALQQRMAVIPEPAVRERLILLQETSDATLLVRRESVERECLMYEGILGIASLGRAFLVGKPTICSSSRINKQQCDAEVPTRPQQHHGAVETATVIAAVQGNDAAVRDNDAAASAEGNKTTSAPPGIPTSRRRPQSAHQQPSKATHHADGALPPPPPPVSRSLYQDSAANQHQEDEEMGSHGVGSGDEPADLNAPLEAFESIHQVVLNELIITFDLQDSNESAAAAAGGPDGCDERFVTIPLHFLLDSLYCAKIHASANFQQQSRNNKANNEETDTLNSLWRQAGFVQDTVNSLMRVLSARCSSSLSSGGGSRGGQQVRSLATSSYVSLDDICVALVCTIPQQTVTAKQVVAFVQEFVLSGIRPCAAEHAVDGGGAVENAFYLLDVHHTRLAPKPLCESVFGVEFGVCPTGVVSFVEFSRSLRRHAQRSGEELEMVVQKSLSTRYFGSLLKQKCDSGTTDTRQREVKAAATESKGFAQDLQEMLHKVKSSPAPSLYLQGLLQAVSKSSEVTVFALTRMCIIVLLLLRKRLFRSELSSYMGLASLVEVATTSTSPGSSSHARRMASIGIIERFWCVLNGDAFGKDLDWVLESLGIATADEAHLVLPWAALDGRVVEMADFVLRHPIVLASGNATLSSSASSSSTSAPIRDINSILFSVRHYLASIVTVAKLHKISAKLLDPHTFFKDMSLVANSDEGASSFPFLLLRRSLLNDGDGTSAAAASGAGSRSPRSFGKKPSSTWTPRFLEMLFSLPKSLQKGSDVRYTAADSNVRIPAAYPRRPQSALSSFQRGNQMSSRSRAGPTSSSYLRPVSSLGFTAAPPTGRPSWKQF